MNIIELQNVSQSYFSKKDILKNVSLNIKNNSIHCLIGQNGSGKTTLIKTIIGALPNFKGQIKIQNQKNRKSLFSYLPEKAIFPKGMTALQYVSYIGFINQKSLKDTRKKAIALFNKYGLSKFLKSWPNKLSSGEKKKIMLMQTLINDADIFILDEPSANLDPIVSTDLKEIFVNLKKAGKTIFLVTHNLTLFEDIIEDVSVLHHGKILFSGTSQKFANGKPLIQQYIKTIKDYEKR